MLSFQPKDPQFKDRVRASFERQSAMATLGIQLCEVEPGQVMLRMPFHAAYTQQHGFMHAGIVATALDNTCGYAAFSLMPADAAVLTVEFKVNLLAPAQGKTFEFEGTVIKPGRTVTVCEGKGFAVHDGQRKLIATMTATLMSVFGRDGISH